MIKIFKYVWQLPQHLLGLLVIVFTQAKTYNKGYYYITSSYRRMGVSLGQYRIIGADSECDKTINHEVGHSVQSLRWGPLYLITVGFTSAIINNLIGARLLKKDHKWYYSRWPENEADRLGGVTRGNKSYV